MDEFEIAEQTARTIGVTPWWPSVEPTPRWIRVMVGDTVVADSRRALLYLQYGPYPLLPTYYIPLADVADDVLRDPAPQEDGSTRFTVHAGGFGVPEAAWTYRDPAGEFEALTGAVTFTWQSPAVRWFEEDEELLAHARDPHKRVDVAPSSRHVVVRVDGHVVAESHRPLTLFETTLPTRYYLPPEDVRSDLLEPSTTRSVCPYKGWAQYWHVRVGDRLHEDLVWSYPDPVPENPRIRGLMAFWSEKAEILVDGVPDTVPSPWSADAAGVDAPAERTAPGGVATSE